MPFAHSFRNTLSIRRYIMESITLSMSRYVLKNIGLRARVLRICLQTCRVGLERAYNYRARLNFGFRARVGLGYPKFVLEPVGLWKLYKNL